MAGTVCFGRLSQVMCWTIFSGLLLGLWGRQLGACKGHLTCTLAGIGLSSISSLPGTVHP